jgi:hypothetical protein
MILEQQLVAFNQPSEDVIEKLGDALENSGACIIFGDEEQRDTAIEVLLKFGGYTRAE